MLDRLTLAARSRSLVLEPTLPSILPLEARSLSYATATADLIKGVDLKLEAGRRAVIIGPNGAGKSLLLRLLHGLVVPTSGAVLWGGRSLDASIKRRQAMVFQSPVLLRRSVAANVAFALRVKGVPRAERRERVGAALELAHLTHLARRPARLLSGGERQRLAIARAMSVAPELLFLDEPTASLDPAQTQAVEELIGAAHRRGTKIVLVTHDLGQARRLADEIVFMRGGRIGESGPAQSFFERPATSAAEDFLDGRIVL